MSLVLAHKVPKNPFSVPRNQDEVNNHFAYSLAYPCSNVY